MPVVALVSPAFPSIGLEYLSAVLRRDGFHVAGYTDPHAAPESRSALVRSAWSLQQRRLTEWIKRLRPAVVGITSTTYTYRQALASARAIRDCTTAPLIFGGIHASLVPERVLAETGADTVVVGEAEDRLSLICRRLIAGEPLDLIPLTYYRRGDEICFSEGAFQIEDLDRLPFPDRSLFGFRGGVYPCISARGCALGNCSFCIPNRFNKPYRVRDSESVVEEIAWHKIRFPLRSVNFYDSILTADRDRLLHLMQLYAARVRLPFVATSHLAFFDREIGLALCDAGCRQISFGLQTWDSDICRRVLNRGCDIDRVSEVMSICRDLGLSVALDHMLNLPAPKEDLRKTIESYLPLRRLGLRMVNPNALWYYPRTAITELAHRQGFLTDHAMDLIESGIETRSVQLVAPPKGMSAAEARRGAILIWACGILPASWTRKLATLPPKRFAPFILGASIVLSSAVRLARRDVFFIFRLQQLASEIRLWVKLLCGAVPPSTLIPR